MQIVYIPSESMSVQGKKDEIYKRYGKDWNIREQGGGNGNWLLTRKSDVLVDGKYMEDKRDLTLKWRGSKNQRVIDVQKSFLNGELVLWTA